MAAVPRSPAPMNRGSAFLILACGILLAWSIADGAHAKDPCESAETVSSQRLCREALELGVMSSASAMEALDRLEPEENKAGCSPYSSTTLRSCGNRRSEPPRNAGLGSSDRPESAPDGCPDPSGP